jgi:Type II transport protein GspH
VRRAPARGRRGGSGPFPTHGVSLVGLCLALTVAVALIVAAVPTMASLSAAVAVRSAAYDAATALYRARAYAIARNVHVGVKFRRNGNRYEWALYRDGNGNGVRTAEIARGVDKPLPVYVPWARRDVLPSILADCRVPDPGNPGSYLDHPEDPIRFGVSDICSFSPAGESSPGSIYLSDGRNRMAVVRVLGRTAKIRVLYWRRGDRAWRK